MTKKLAGNNDGVMTMPPLPSSKNISRAKLLLPTGHRRSKSASITDTLKIQHAAELAETNEVHAIEVASLENDVRQYRSEIEGLRALSEENTDVFMPLPTPSTSLKFVKNIPPRKSRKKDGGLTGASGGHVDGKKMFELKARHTKELARASELYSKKMQSLRREVERYKAETEALKASSSSPTSKDRSNKKQQGSTRVNTKTGVAEKEKENVGQRNNVLQSRQTKAGNSNVHKLNQPKRANNGESVLGMDRRIVDEEAVFKAQYDRSFSKEYKFEMDPAIEEAIALSNTVIGKNASVHDDIDGKCNELMSFMDEIKGKCLSCQ